MTTSNAQIAILITTFERDNTLYKNIDALLSYIQNNFIILIADQGHFSEEKEKWILKNQQRYPKNFIYKKLSYNCGLSYARNYLVDLAKENKYDYILLSSDSFLFNESIQKINKIVDFLNSNDSYDLIGFELKNCVCDWEANLNLIPNEHFELNFINKQEPSNRYKDILIFDCDIVRNFFLAKINPILHTGWDNNLKGREHEDFFWRYKQNNYKVGWTDYIWADKINDKPNIYQQSRNQNMQNGLKYLKKKYKIKNWVKYINLNNAKR